jgi:hypothetical protein
MPVEEGLESSPVPARVSAAKNNLTRTDEEELLIDFSSVDESTSLMPQMNMG